MYIKTKSIHFDAMTITLLMLGKFVCTFFMGRLRTFLDKDQISSGRVKGRGKKVYGGEAQNEGYFCKISIIQQDISFISQTTNTWPDKLLITTIAIAMPKNLYAGTF